MEVDSEQAAEETAEPIAQECPSSGGDHGAQSESKDWPVSEGDQDQVHESGGNQDKDTADNAEDQSWDLDEGDDKQNQSSDLVEGDGKADDQAWGKQEAVDVTDKQSRGNDGDATAREEEHPTVTEERSSAKDDETKKMEEQSWGKEDDAKKVEERSWGKDDSTTRREEHSWGGDTAGKKDERSWGAWGGGWKKWQPDESSGGAWGAGKGARWGANNKNWGGRWGGAPDWKQERQHPVPAPRAETERQRYEEKHGGTVKDSKVHDVDLQRGPWGTSELKKEFRRDRSRSRGRDKDKEPDHAALKEKAPQQAANEEDGENENGAGGEADNQEGVGMEDEADAGTDAAAGTGEHDVMPWLTYEKLAEDPLIKCLPPDLRDQVPEGNLDQIVAYCASLRDEVWPNFGLIGGGPNGDPDVETLKQLSQRLVDRIEVDASKAPRVATNDLVKNFCAVNMLSQESVAALKNLKPETKARVIRAGPVIGWNRDVTLMARIRRSLRGEKIQDAAVAGTGRQEDISDVKQFLMENWVGSASAKVLQTAEPEVQRMVLEKGPLLGPTQAQELKDRMDVATRDHADAMEIQHRKEQDAARAAARDRAAREAAALRAAGEHHGMHAMMHHDGMAMHQDMSAAVAHQMAAYAAGAQTPLVALAAAQDPHAMAAALAAGAQTPLMAQHMQAVAGAYGGAQTPLMNQHAGAAAAQSFAAAFAGGQTPLTSQAAHFGAFSGAQTPLAPVSLPGSMGAAAAAMAGAQTPLYG